MRVEHVAFMMPDPPAAAAWYVVHLGLQIVRYQESDPWAHFLADEDGHVMLEIYTDGEGGQIPDYRAMDPLVLHLAFVSDNMQADRDRLLAAGASAQGDIVVTPVGDQLAMLRDPWGFCIQLAQRAEAMI